MKLITLVLSLGLMACAPVVAATLEVTGQLGAAVPTGDVEVGYSPSISARGMYTFDFGKLRVGAGLMASHEFNFVEKDRPQADGSRGNGLSNGIYASGIHIGGQDQEQDQDQSQSQEQNVNIDLGEAQGISPRILRDLAPSSIFTVAPIASIGYLIGDFLPYVAAGASLNRVTRQDGLSNWGNGVFVAGGFNYYFEQGWFGGAEISRHSIDSEVATYRNNKYLFQVGKRF